MVAGAEAHAVDITKEKAPDETVTKIDARDVGTPDEWVPERPARHHPHHHPLQHLLHCPFASAALIAALAIAAPAATLTTTTLTASLTTTPHRATLTTSPAPSLPPSPAPSPPP